MVAEWPAHRCSGRFELEVGWGHQLGIGLDAALAHRFEIATAAVRFRLHD
jgi:hypothetical protein